jgi:Uma2 family endonuclease
MGAELSLPRRALSVEDFHRMGEVGLLRPDERVELIHGDLITMAPIGGPHIYLVSVVAQLLTVGVGRTGFVSVQNPISLPPESEPQPDIALLRPEFWQRAAVPTARDVLLVIEVSDTTLAYDRDVKIPLYARHGIPEAWQFHIGAEQLFVHRDPGPDGYRTVSTLKRTDTIAPLAFPAVKITLAEVWPKS